MSEQNVNFLHDSLLYLGFGKNTPIHHALDEQLKQQPETFELDTEAFFDEESRIEARLHFKAGNGPNEGMNNLLKRVKRVAFGFTNFANFRIRALLYAGKPNFRVLDSIVVT